MEGTRSWKPPPAEAFAWKPPAEQFVHNVLDSLSSHIGTLNFCRVCLSVAETGTKRGRIGPVTVVL